MEDDQAKNEKMALEVLEKFGYVTRCPEHGELILTEKGKRFKIKLAQETNKSSN